MVTIIISSLYKMRSELALKLMMSLRRPMGWVSSYDLLTRRQGKRPYFSHFLVTFPCASRLSKLVSSYPRTLSCFKAVPSFTSFVGDWFHSEVSRSTTTNLFQSSRPSHTTEECDHSCMSKKYRGEQFAYPFSYLKKQVK